MGAAINVPARKRLDLTRIDGWEGAVEPAIRRVWTYVVV